MSRPNGYTACIIRVLINHPFQNTIIHDRLSIKRQFFPPSHYSTDNDGKHYHDGRIATCQVSIQSRLTYIFEDTYVAIAFPQSLTQFKFVITSGDNVHMDAIPTIPLMTSLPNICGTTLNTTTVDKRAKATRTIGVSKAVPVLEADLILRGGETLRRSVSLSRKADSCSSMGVCSAIQVR